MARFLELCLDTADPLSDIATFWAAVSGGRPTPATSDGPADVVGDHEQHGISICPVPEPKTVKNRVHLDLMPTDRTRDEEVARLLALGATLVADRRQPDGTGWVVLADPEGNEFCVERSAAERTAGPAATG